MDYHNRTRELEVTIGGQQDVIGCGLLGAVFRIGFHRTADNRSTYGVLNMKIRGPFLLLFLRAAMTSCGGHGTNRKTSGPFAVFRAVCACRSVTCSRMWSDDIAFGLRC